MNEKNLRVPTSEEAREIGKKGGQASGKSRRARKTQKELLKLALDMNIKSVPVLKKSAMQLGLDEEQDLQLYLTVAAIVNSAKSGGISTLMDIAEFLGENKQDENANVIDKLDKVIGEVDKLAK